LFVDYCCPLVIAFLPAEGRPSVRTLPHDGAEMWLFPSLRAGRPDVKEVSTRTGKQAGAAKRTRIARLAGLCWGVARIIILFWFGVGPPAPGVAAPVLSGCADRPEGRLARAFAARAEVVPTEMDVVLAGGRSQNFRDEFAAGRYWALKYDEFMPVG
jgi:hypothetical protein